MSRAATQESVAQMQMPGMPEPSSPVTAVNVGSLWPGQEVLYLGRLAGGPRYGTRGVVKRAVGRSFLVDMGRSGTWRVPHYFLGLPLRSSHAVGAAISARPLPRAGRPHVHSLTQVS